MGKVVKLENAIFTGQVYQSELGRIFETIISVAQRNSGGLLFFAWSYGHPPPRSEFSLASVEDVLWIATAAVGYGVPSAIGQGRIGIYIKAYIDERPIPIKWPPGFADRFNEQTLSQDKGRRWVTVTGNDYRDRALIRVPHG